MKEKSRFAKIICGIATLFCCIFGVLVGNKVLVVKATQSCGVNVSDSFTSKNEHIHGINDIKVRGKSAYLMDFGTKTPIYAKNEYQRLPIASMCKMMTLLLTFEAIQQDILSMDEEISISERAASMGGSQVFLEANAKYPLNELIKSIVVCSANDSCVALAERIAGSEDAFVAKMNEKAKAIGANDTLFANCTGLPKEPQYSCAKDVAIILKNLLNHDDYYRFSRVWTDKFQHPKGRYTEITNTNKLVRYYDGCDGGKTGFTNEAGFCLAATAKRGNLRVISVVIGEENSKDRFDDVRLLFDHAFANYAVSPVLEDGKPIKETVCVIGGKTKTLSVYPARSYYAFHRRGKNENIVLKTNFNRIKAPVKKGDYVGEIIIYNEGVEVEKIPLLSANDVQKASIFDCIQDIAKDWTAR